MPSSSPACAPYQIAERLLDPCRAGVSVVETHVSTLFFEGALVHKRKKPVHFAFVDLSTSEQRRRMCHLEVELNRRFSPDVYLGVEDIVDDAGRVVDHAVLMRRMPEDRRLASMVRQRRDAPGVSARWPGRWPRGTARRSPTPRSPRWRHLRRSTTCGRGTCAEIAPFQPHPLPPGIVARIDELAHRYLHGRTALLADRIARGQIVDGHGDLLTEDIFCLEDGPRILDGLEFDERLRWGDVLYDVGFLAMDLERLGRLDLAFAFLNWYREYSAETHPRSLEHHYIAYRALVRAKISCLKGSADDETEAHAYLVLCQRHLLDAQVQLVVIGGLPGTGKTALAAALGDELGWPVLRSDETRKELAGLDPLDHAPAPYGEGLYTPTATAATYRALFVRARQLLERGESVVIDASFSNAARRARAAALAADTTADLTELQCLLPADVAAARLARRAAAGGDASDATAVVAAAMADEFDPWPSAEPVGHPPASGRRHPWRARPHRSPDRWCGAGPCERRDAVEMDRASGSMTTTAHRFIAPARDQRPFAPVEGTSPLMMGSSAGVCRWGQCQSSAPRTITTGAVACSGHRARHGEAASDQRRRAAASSTADRPRAPSAHGTTGRPAPVLGSSDEQRARRLRRPRGDESRRWCSGRERDGGRRDGLHCTRVAPGHTRGPAM